MKSLLLLIACLGWVAASAGETLPVPKMEKYRAGDWEDEIGYREAVRVGNTLYVSGLVGTGPMDKAIPQVYNDLAKTLGRFGLTFAHVVKENAYTTDLDALKAHLALRRAYYGKEFPAATWVQVSRLYEPQYVLEVEVIAVFPDAAK